MADRERALASGIQVSLQYAEQIYKSKYGYKQKSFTTPFIVL